METQLKDPTIRVPRATPPPAPRPMPTQDLQPFGLRDIAALLRFEIPRVARNVATGLAWLVLLVTP